MYNVYPQRSLPTTPSSPRKCNSIAQSNFSGFNVCRIYRSRPSHQPRSQKGWLCLCFFFFYFLQRLCLWKGEESVKRRWLWTLLSLSLSLHCVRDFLHRWHSVIFHFAFLSYDWGSNLFIENIIRDVPRDNNDPWKLAARSGLEREVLLLVQSARRRGGP